ncbi:acyclic terpene utilization AtuA family protein [Kushneria konosiri]|uniref:Acyclic terpene utilisation N-terminal domain-containing protein n=1 Tax=Kushneria konosiri TaxID=698828 RepID=A0A2Z2HAF9_9GAMM|nr:acyclic terpene utilization AtuA family protein [Kushneria konosiri]ARS54408.1 hypothetical protein B9G99_04470 [Kushneria konosiri]
MTDTRPDQTTLHIGYGAGFAGDRPQAALALARDLASRHGPRYLALELLAERTLAQCQQRRHDDERSGYALRLFDFLEPILPICLESRIPVITNGGAAHPVAAAYRLRTWLDAQGFHNARIACVLGDDLFEQLGTTPSPDWLPEDVVLDEVVSCNVYIGAERIQQALEEGADIVLCGRVADPSMAVGAIRHGLGWSADDPGLTAIALATGHLLECCTQITGGYFADPITNPIPDPAHPGCPIIELGAEGQLIVTKTAGTGGMVSARTVKEQLLYEIHDPAAYLTPDGVMDISRAQVIDHGDNRVEVRGIQGRPAPATLKGNLGLKGLWFGEAGISYAGPRALARAQLAREIVMTRAAELAPNLAPRLDIVGFCSVLGDAGGAVISQRPDIEDGVDDARLRLGVVDRDRGAIEALLYDFESLYTNGPAGGGGIRTHLVESLRTEDFLIDRHAVPTFLAWY